MRYPTVELTYGHDVNVVYSLMSPKKISASLYQYGRIFSHFTITINVPETWRVLETVGVDLI